jgi:polyhydroxyalkanoate synthesis regulator phasin
MPKGKMTLEKLARMVQQSFASMEGSMNQRIDAVQEELGGRLDGLQVEVSGVHRQLNRAVYESEFHALENRVTALERKTRIRTK